MEGNLQDNVKKVFEEAFGRTPLNQRLQDILSESIELSRCVDIKKIKEELGDLLASAIMLANEGDWKIEDLVEDTLIKIERRKEQYKTLGRKTQVAILGGAFNPIHNGHIQVSQFVLNASKTFDEVWLMPAYGHMYGKEMASPQHRLAMCEIAAQVDARIKVFDFEIMHQLRGETYQTVKLLKEDPDYKDQYDFSWIIGLDNANTFDKWVNYEHLEKLIRFIVIPRKGYTLDTNVNWLLKPPHIFLGESNNPIIEISSSDIRKAVRNYVKYSDPTLIYNEYMNSEVVKYITANKLYY